MMQTLMSNIHPMGRILYNSKNMNFIWTVFYKLQRVRGFAAVNQSSSVAAVTTIVSTRYFSDSKQIKRGKTPIGKLDQTEAERPENKDEPDPYAPFPEGKNPVTGEIGGPRGPEPTRYGDWERKGRVSDF